MNDNRRYRALLQQVFSRSSVGQHLYAVIDGARDEKIHEAIASSGMPARCLYAGALPPPLARVAPYLVRVHPVHPLTRELLTTKWGDSWGVFLTSSAGIEEMRRHLRRFLRAKLEDGRSVVFRYYDPRVLRTYLPTCTSDELEQLFGPISAFFVEGEGGSTLLTYERAAGSFAMAKMSLPVVAPHEASHEASQARTAL